MRPRKKFPEVKLGRGEVNERQVLGLCVRGHRVSTLPPPRVTGASDGSRGMSGNM